MICQAGRRRSATDDLGEVGRWRRSRRCEVLAPAGWSGIPAVRAWAAITPEVVLAAAQGLSSETQTRPGSGDVPSRAAVAGG